MTDEQKQLVKKIIDQRHQVDLRGAIKTAIERDTLKGGA